jgi:glutamate transport system substrate-binding protein
MTGRRSTWRLITVIGVVLALIVSVAACGDDDDEQQTGAQEGQTQQTAPAGTSVARLQEEGEITVGVKFDVPPFGFKNPQSGEVEGFDVEIGKAIADELGVEPRFVEAVSDNRIPFLKRGTVDLILSTMTINAERDQEIDFSEPYYVARGRILVPRGSDIRGVDDLAGTTVCTALGSTYEETLREQAPEAERRLVDSYSECLELIQTNAVDAISTDDVILTGMIIQDDSLELVGGEELTTEPYGAGIREGDAELQELVNGVIADMKADGRWADLYQEWIGQYTDERQQPPTMTLEEALAL